jgi:DNA modification methylase
MHQELDRTWQQVIRVLVPGGIACINIGDATRSFDGEFRLYPNHARIIQAFLRFGCFNLPNILWRKTTNAPNKFMGSGMLPAGAYVTLEHEWILIFRKGGKRSYSEQEKELRHQSAIFWEERNQWFSDLWELTGTRQKLTGESGRERSGAYPFEIPHRLIRMFSLYQDTVLDPFLGTGTTAMAAMASGRNSIGFELDSLMVAGFHEQVKRLRPPQLAKPVLDRLKNHQQFLRDRNKKSGNAVIKHFNDSLKLPVMTLQEKKLQIYLVNALQLTDPGEMKVNYQLLDGPVQEPDQLHLF